MYTREQMVTLALKYKGASKGSARHKDLVNTFNKVKPNGEVANYKCAWCAITVTALAIKAGFTTKNFPMSYNCGTMITKAKALGIWKETDSYKPKIGDVIIYSWTDPKPSTELKTGASHTGIVVSVSGNNFDVLEGNKGTSSACGIRKMKVNGQYIRGFIVPKYTAGKPVNKPTTKYSGTIPTSELKYGDKGSAVKSLQEFLNFYHAEWKLAVDGSFGSKTENALMGFQMTEALEVDGIYGPKTKARAKTYASKKSYSGKFPELHVKRTSQEVANGAAEWAKKIATMNNFHYGEGGSSKMDFGKSVYAITHSGGCYFCGTNKTKKVNKIKALKRSDLVPDHWYRTYVCNPFVYSAWVHGGLVQNMTCSKNGNLSIFTSSSTFKNLGHPSFSSLKKGDVLLKYVNGTFKHAAIYVGDGKYSEATSYTGKYGNAASKSSIRTKTLTSSHYKDFNVVCRFNKSIDADISIKIGERSSRVGDWQDYLNWWSGGAFFKECGERDNMFGDDTKKWTVKFQEKELGEGKGDGIVGSKTLAAAKAVKK